MGTTKDLLVEQLSIWTTLPWSGQVASWDLSQSVEAIFHQVSDGKSFDGAGLPGLRQDGSAMRSHVRCRPYLGPAVLVDQAPPDLAAEGGSSTAGQNGEAPGPSIPMLDLFAGAGGLSS